MTIKPSRSAAKSLYVTLALIIVSTITVIMSVHGTYTYLQTKSSMIEAIKTDSERSVITLRNNITDLIAAYAVNEYSKNIQTEINQHDFFAIVLEDKNMGELVGREFYISGKIKDGKGNIIDYDPKNAEQNHQLETMFYSYRQPVVDNFGKTLGRITVYVSDRSINQKLNDIIASTLVDGIVLSVLLILSLLVSLRFFHIKPIANIITAINNSGQDGIPQEQVPASGPKEVYVLAEAINQMLQAVKTSRSQLHQLNLVLSGKVEEGIRQRMQLEEEKFRQERVLIQQSKLIAMGEMVGAIAHHWRQPLNALGLNIQDITDAYRHNELSEEYITRVSDKSMDLIFRMSQTIDDFREFFKSDAPLHDFDMIQTINKAIHLLKAELEHKSIDIAFDPDGLSEAHIHGSPGQLVQVIHNLLLNSVDAFAHNRPTPPYAVTLNLTHSDGGYHLTYSDNAGGTDEEVMERIFEPYFTTKEQGEGTGIGLYMNKTIIENTFKGTISARQEHGGLIFEIILKPSDGTQSAAPVLI